VIRYRDTLSRSQPPPWLAGAPNLHRRPGREGEVWVCGDVIFASPDGPWLPIGDGYEVAGPVDNHTDYLKGAAWVSTEPVQDLYGREWQAPRILDAAGERVFRVSYGADFLPSLTPEQYRMLDMAKVARDAIAASTSGTQDAGTQMACRWAAEFLACTYRLPVPAIAALCVMDDMLAIGTLSVAIGLSCEVKP
jgi:hypothetical protein